MPIQAFVGVLFVGIAIGMLLSIVTYSFVRRRRDFASVMQVVADHYEVTVATDSVQRARQVLGRRRRRPAPDATRRAASRLRAAPAPPPSADAAAEPPRYGERVAARGRARRAAADAARRRRAAERPDEGDASEQPKP